MTWIYIVCIVGCPFVCYETVSVSRDHLVIHTNTLTYLSSSSCTLLNYTLVRVSLQVLIPDVLHQFYWRYSCRSPSFIIHRHFSLPVSAFHHGSRFGNVVKIMLAQQEEESTFINTLLTDILLRVTVSHGLHLMLRCTISFDATL